jgi:ribosomal protein L29
MKIKELRELSVEELGARKREIRQEMLRAAADWAARKPFSPSHSAS